MGVSELPEPLLTDNAFVSLLLTRGMAGLCIVAPVSQPQGPETPSVRRAGHSLQRTQPPLGEVRSGPSQPLQSLLVACREGRRSSVCAVGRVLGHGLGGLGLQTDVLGCLWAALLLSV